jgi:hypothetical protein
MEIIEQAIAGLLDLIGMLPIGFMVVALVLSVLVLLIILLWR